MHITRRGFAFVLGGAAQSLRAAQADHSQAISEVLARGIERRKIPAVAAMVATKDRIIYQGAFGKRDAASNLDVKVDSIFAIASMTKAITSTAALQLVERGQLSLTEPTSKYLPELANLPVLDGFDASGTPTFHTVRTPITLKHLLTHTSGFCYDRWSDEMVRWEKATGRAFPVPGVAPLVPLMFEPGTRWHYGYSLDWTGKLVEAVSGLTLEQYFQQNILGPLDMRDTTFILPPEKFERLVSLYDRQSAGHLQQRPRAIPTMPAAFNGGGGLYSTANDYIKFTQMILRKGRGPGGQILHPKTVAMMSANQIGALGAGRLKTQNPATSSDVDLHPGATDRWGLGFLINETAYPGGRSAGSLAWAGLNNTFYWIDPKRGLCAVIMMQFLPFVDQAAVGMLTEFERAVYAA